MHLFGYDAADLKRGRGTMLKNVRSVGVRSLSLAMAAFVLVAIGYLLRNHAFPSPAQLLARAYIEQRSLELRICRTPHSLLRARRGDETSRTDRPQSLLDAEALIAKGLRNHPEDSSLLVARGQANLLEGAYEAAITDM